MFNGETININIAGFGSTEETLPGDSTIRQ